MKNLIGLWCNLSRAYEIAKFANLSIRIVFSPEYKEGFCDYGDIKAFFKDVAFKKDGDLIVEISKPSSYSDNFHAETMEDVEARINLGKQNKLPTECEGQKDAKKALLKRANEVLKLSLKDCNLIEYTAQKIAQLDGSDKINIEHVAEAIHYRSIGLDSFCDAEENKICFGDGIEIANFEIEKEDIKNAINHLTNLLNQ